uniref:Uncharacterized protein n=1 Tax=Chrysemys picta bellii TaxID=8478 RepID=A0A8C3FNS8_CHRPI
CYRPLFHTFPPEATTGERKSWREGASGSRKELILPKMPLELCTSTQQRLYLVYTQPSPIFQIDLRSKLWFLACALTSQNPRFKPFYPGVSCLINYGSCTAIT